MVMDLLANLSHPYLIFCFKLIYFRQDSTHYTLKTILYLLFQDICYFINWYNLVFLMRKSLVHAMRA